MLCLVPFCHSFVARPYLICHACILYTNGVDAIDNYDSTDIHTVYLVARILFILILCLRLRLHTQTHTQLHDTRAVVMALQRPRRTNIVYTLYSTHGSMQDQTAVLQSKFCVQYTYSDAFFSLAFALSLSLLFVRIVREHFPIIIFRPQRGITIYQHHPQPISFHVAHQTPGELRVHLASRFRSDAFGMECGTRTGIISSYALHSSRQFLRRITLFFFFLVLSLCSLLFSYNCLGKVNKL